MNSKNCKRLVKRLLYNFTALLPFGLLRKACGNRVLILNYHSIQGWDADEVIRKNNTYRSIEEFEEDILFLKKNYSFVDLPAFLSYSKREGTVPVNSVLLTFDDGLSVIYSHIRPILVKHGVPAVFFINPHFVDNKDLHYQRKKNLLQGLYKDGSGIQYSEKLLRLLEGVGIEADEVTDGIAKVGYNNSGVLNDLASIMSVSFQDYLSRNKIYLDTTQIQKMIDHGFYFGAHSLDHPDYNDLSIQKQFDQTVGSIDQVCDKYKQEQRVFAFPRKDSKIMNELFEKIAPYCEASFGVGGMIDDEIEFHWHRTDIESSKVKASLALKFYYCTAILKKLFGAGVLKRG